MTDWSIARIYPRFLRERQVRRNGRRLRDGGRRLQGDHSQPQDGDRVGAVQQDGALILRDPTAPAPRLQGTELLRIGAGA
eukprot:8870428-Pyramimonas_sp.AAC.1